MKKSEKLVFGLDDRVVELISGDILTIKRILSGEVTPYHCSDGNLYEPHEIKLYVPKEPTWEQVQRGLLNKFNDIRTLFANEDLSYVDINIACCGNTHSELEVTYRVGKGYDDNVKGGDIDACTQEFLRKKTWEKRNDPLKIAHVREEDNETVF